MAQHALGREDDKRLAPHAAHLAAQQVEILRGGRGLANLHVVFRGELHEALHACAGMLRPLAFVAVRQKHHETRRQVPFIFAGADELVDDDLRAVGKIAELRFPQNERFGIVAAETVFETEAAGLGKRRVVNLAESLLLGKMREREVVVLRLSVDQNRVALAERAALRILPRETHGIALEKYGAERQHFGEAVINSTLAMPHFRALLEKLRDFRMEVKSLRQANEGVGDFREFFLQETGIDLIFRFVAAMPIRGPVVRQFAQMRYFSYRAGLGLLLFVFLADSLNQQGGVD